MLYRISVAERGPTGIANIFRSRLSRLDDLLRAGTVPLNFKNSVGDRPFKTLAAYALQALCLPVRNVFSRMSLA